ncbi:hypothetical protein H257_08031 [Aphanomyces astaci]|uniref:Maltase n=3 Tax=Aphanomyces astaci TaxID=112090 RepID=W4GFR4_APHAT|nr:hypothetical protein H257_08031 [Aphanomyces astaci]ETV78515.1 hypothetical protein H257_08031 [Aphanomyces astaci]|eukprot:XP_009832096.1 hypothetical protein H257_08031 [Aphanomyces astaci]
MIMSLKSWLTGVAVLTLVAATSRQEADQCAAPIPSPRLDCYPVQVNFPNATEETCLAQGCCWDALDAIPCAFGRTTAPSTSLCDAVLPASRLACRNPRYFLTATDATTCAALGCCFDGTECFQPSFLGYDLKPQSWVETTSGYTGTLVLRSRGPFGNDISELSVEVTADASDQVRVRIFDPSFRRYEVPLPLHHPTTTRNSSSRNSTSSRLYSVSVTSSPFGIAITRISTGETLFNSTPAGHFNGLVFANQYLELSTSMPTSAPPTFFGLGEHVGRFLGNASGDRYTIWARDQPADTFHVHTSKGGDNVYGVHPFYIRVEDSGLAHGVFLLNSNALEAVATPHAITFRTVGGIIDLFVFVGPSAPSVVAQYTALVGRPMIPPYWSLGYHLCRWHYHSLDDVVSVVERMRAAGVPQDAQWTDIDVMDRYLDFTWDPTSFPQPKVSAFVDDLHAHGQHYVPIVDAGIAVTIPSYPAYEDGLAQHVFMKDGSNVSIEQNIVWPGMVAYPDFFHPNATSYWLKQLKRYYATVKYDGIWLDMNEPSSFCIEGGRESLSCVFNDSYAPYTFVRSQDTAYPFDPFRQPFVPGQAVNGNLAAMTASMAAHHVNSLHYNVHSLFGHSEIVATRLAVDSIRPTTRTFILSRSTFAGDGQYTAHWLGDNAATWEDLRQSIAGVLSMNVFGMPMVGPDVCGFGLNTTQELCIRWHQAAILYPFLRNHNMAAKDQAPVDFDNDAIDAIRKTLLERYHILPYLYTLLYRAHVDGSTVARSLYFEFPSKETLAIDSQYLLGSALLVSPVLEPGARQVAAYLPPSATWYDLWTGVPAAATGAVVLPAPLNTVPLHVRGGSIVALQYPNTTTTSSRKNPFRLVVALPAWSSGITNTTAATGELYLDSGNSVNPVQTSVFSLHQYTAKHASNGYLRIDAEAVAEGYTGPETKVLVDAIHVYGVHGYDADSDVHVAYVKVLNKRTATGTYFAANNTLVITDLLIEVGMSFALEVFPLAKHITIAPAPTSRPADADAISTWLYVGVGSATFIVLGGVYQIFSRRRGYTQVL